MQKYPTINYIGNKLKVSDWIIENIPADCNSILDLFSGGCSVSYKLKSKGYKVISNDVLYSNFVLAKYLIENNYEKLTIEDIKNIQIMDEEVDKKFEEINFLVNKLYFDYEVKELAELLVLSKKLKGYKKYIFLSLLRRAMIRKIPYSRMNIKWEEIVKLRDEEYSYKKYKRYRSYHNKSFMYHIEAYLDEYNNAIFDNNQKNEAYQCDSLNLVKRINCGYDLVYIDPPYPSTMNNYDAFYGYFDDINSKKRKVKLDLTKKQTFIINLEKIINQISRSDAKYVMISLNNKTNPTTEDICLMLSKYAEKIDVKSKDHVYKVTGKENKNTTKEILILAKLKGGNKSEKTSN